YTFDDHRAAAMTDKPYKSLEGIDIGTQSNSGYIWLAYSAFFFIDPVLRHNGRLWIESGIIYAVFLVIYVGYMRARTTRQRHLLLAAFYLLGVVSFPINTGASCFFIYSAAFLPFAVASIPYLVAALALQAIGLLIEGLLLHINFIALLLTIALMVIVA